MMVVLISSDKVARLTSEVVIACWLSLRFRSESDSESVSGQLSVSMAVGIVSTGVPSRFTWVFVFGRVTFLRRRSRSRLEADFWWGVW